jgi:hypothetical protein
MSDFRYLCPKCGQAFHEGQAITECPQCKVPLLGTAPVIKQLDLHGLPAEIDVAQLMGQMLGERQADEEINAALWRVLAREYPEHHESLYALLDQELLTVEQLRGCNRLEAAQELARSVSKLQIDPTSGRPQMSMIRMAGNLDALSPEQQEQVRAQLAEAFATGRPLGKMQITLRPPGSTRTSWLGLVVFLAILALAALLVWLRKK